LKYGLDTVDAIYPTIILVKNKAKKEPTTRKERQLAQKQE
jgi:hypothetical protein